MAEKLEFSHPVAEKRISRRLLLRKIRRKSRYPNCRCCTYDWIVKKLIDYANDEKVIKSVVSIIFQNFDESLCLYISTHIGADPNVPFAVEDIDRTNDSNRTFRQVVLAKFEETMAEYEENMPNIEPMLLWDWIWFVSIVFYYSNSVSRFSMPRAHDVCRLLSLMLDYPDKQNLKRLRFVLDENFYYLIKDVGCFEQLMRKLEGVINDVEDISLEERLWFFVLTTDSTGLIFNMRKRKG